MEDGVEGISVAVLDSDVAAPDLWSPKDMSNERETMTIQQRCTLSFSFPPSPGVRTQLSDDSASQPLVKRVIQLPVANTLFRNGRTSTLFAQRWNLQFSKGSTSESVSSRKTWLPQQTLEMGAVFADEGFRFQLNHLLHSHLVPITPARTITDAVGNIVRKVSGSVASAEAAPASEELERAISTAIQSGQMPAQQAGVWALVRPQRYAALDRAAQFQGTGHDLIQYPILSGGRLHKVLSGGGGWGEKHGLLALDPDSDYGHHHKAFKPSFGDDQDVAADKFEALGQVAKPGDTITFYVYSSPSDAEPPNLHKSMFWDSNQAAAATLTFGSLPSTMDAMPEFDTTETEAQAPSVVAVEENHFGMLSEQGMSLESSFINANITANRMQYLRTELHRKVCKVRSRKTVITKLDAPYTLLSIRGQASKVPVSNEIKGEELQAPNVHLENLMPQEPLTAAGTNESASARVQEASNANDQKHEARPSFRQGRDEQVFTETHRRTKLAPVSNEVKGKELQAPNAHLENLMPQEALTTAGTNESASARIQEAFKVNDQEHEALPSFGQGYMRDEQVFTEPQRRIEEERSELTRKEKGAKKPKALKANPSKEAQRNQRIVEGVDILIAKHPEMSEQTARKLVGKELNKARKAEKKADKELQKLSKRKLKEAALTRFKAKKAREALVKRGNHQAKTDDDSPFAIRFTHQEQKPGHNVVLQPEAQDAPPISIKRHFAKSLDKHNQVYGADLNRNPDIKAESTPLSKAFHDNVKHGNKTLGKESKPESQPSASKGKEGNVFMVRRHFTYNPYERLQAIQQAGEITSRDQATGLHGQYHLPLFDRSPEDGQESPVQLSN